MSRISSYPGALPVPVNVIRELSFGRLIVHGLAHEVEYAFQRGALNKESLLDSTLTPSPPTPKLRSQIFAACSDVMRGSFCCLLSTCNSMHHLSNHFARKAELTTICGCLYRYSFLGAFREMRSLMIRERPHYKTAFRERCRPKARNGLSHQYEIVAEALILNKLNGSSL